MTINPVKPDQVINALINIATNKASEFTDFDLVNLFQVITEQNQTIYEQFELNKIQKGLDLLKGRIDQKKENLNPLVKLFLRITKFFGFKDKYEKSSETIDQYKGKIEEIEKKTKAEVKKLDGEITEKQKQIKEKEREIEVFNAELPENQSKSKITGEPSPPINIGAQNGSNNPSKIKNFLGNILGANKKKNNNPKGPKEAERPASITPSAPPIAVPVAESLEISTKRSRIVTLGGEIALLKQELTQKQDRLTKLNKMLGTTEKISEVSKRVFKPISEPEFQQLIQDVFQNEKGKFYDDLVKIKGRILPTPHRINEYNEFQRKLIFGFSVGQNIEIEKLKKAGFTEQELGKLLEGGNSAVNYFYIALTLEKLSQDNPALKSLASDFKRSLKIALKLQTNADLKEVEKEIKETVQKLGQGERLFIPTGTESHATLLCLEKLPNGKVKATHYNTGEGVKVNKNKTGSTKVTYNSLDLTNIDLTKIIGKRTNVEELYKNLEKGFGVGEEGPEKPIQINGTCSFQVISAAFEDILGKDYQQYRKEHLHHIDQEFTQSSEKLAKDNALLDPKYKALHEMLAEANQANNQR